MADSSEKPESEKVGEEPTKVVEETKEEATKPVAKSSENGDEKSEKVEEPTDKVEAAAQPMTEVADFAPPAEPAAVVVNAEDSNTDQPKETVEAEPETPGMQETHEFSAPECQTETVVVYLDRAEVCRSLKITLQRGEHEIIIKNMSECIDEDSIRVEGSGAATISEVSFQKKFIPPHQVEPEMKQEKVEKLQQELNDAMNDFKLLQSKKMRLTKQRQVLDGLADKLVSIPDANSKTEAASSLLSTEAIQNMVGFVEMYGAQTATLDVGLHELDQDIVCLEDTMRAIRRNLSEMNVTTMMDEARVLCVLLDVTKDTDIQLKMSYVVSKAKWSPKYDLRVFSTDGQMKIFYYGIVQQTTGEDWTDTRLILSTAMPSIGGNIPELDSWRLGFKPKPTKPVQKSSSFLKKAPAQMVKMRNAMTLTRKAPAVSETAAETMVFPKGDFEEELDEFVSVPLLSNQAQVKENVTSTMYEIPRVATIPCDNVGHKVSVAIIDLEPTFQHECVPKRSSHAFLRAHVKNTSPYALLAGPSNIFLNNNFIAKANLNAVSPSEEFDCSLGVDPTVKVVYKPVHKFREQSGFMAKHVTFTYRQEIAIKNTRQDNITVHVVDQLPQSTEEKIKVKLLEPDVKPADKHSAAKPAKLNAQNNIEWEATIAPGETKELVLKYSVEYPAGEEIV